LKQAQNNIITYELPAVKRNSGEIIVRVWMELEQSRRWKFLHIERARTSSRVPPAANTRLLLCTIIVEHLYKLSVLDAVILL